MVALRASGLPTRLHAMITASAAGPELASTATVRRAHRDDLDALVALEQRVFSSDRLSARQWRQHIDSASASVFVATEDSGSVLGAAVVFYRSGAGRARLYSLSSAPEARGRGVAYRLLRAAEVDAHERGCTHMRLEVRRDNEPGLRLYARSGYAFIGERRTYYEDGADALCFEKPLAT